MPVVVDNNIYLNSCGGGSLSNVICQNVCQNVNALDTVSHVNMIASDYDALLMDFHKAFDNNTDFAPQHGSPPGPMIARVEPSHYHFPRNVYLQLCHGLIHKIDRFNYAFVNFFDNSCSQFVYIHNYSQNQPGDFFQFSREAGQINILECLSHPVGALQVYDSVRNTI